LNIMSFVCILKFGGFTLVNQPVVVVMNPIIKSI